MDCRATRGSTIVCFQTQMPSIHSSLFKFSISFDSCQQENKFTWVLRCSRIMTHCCLVFGSDKFSEFFGIRVLKNKFHLLLKWINSFILWIFRGHKSFFSIQRFEFISLIWVVPFQGNYSEKNSLRKKYSAKMNLSFWS